jgi:hypothetical protein
MIRKDIPPHKIVYGSLNVLATLVQALRVDFDKGIPGILRSLNILGAIGIRPDNETMEYFRLSVDMKLNSPHSSHHNRALLPNKEKFRSLFNVDKLPYGMEINYDLPKSAYQLITRSESSLITNVSYVETDDNEFIIHISYLLETLPDSEQYNRYQEMKSLQEEEYEFKATESTIKPIKEESKLKIDQQKQTSDRSKNLGGLSKEDLKSLKLIKENKVYQGQGKNRKWNPKSKTSTKPIVNKRVNKK